MKVVMIKIEMPDEERERRIDEWIKFMCTIGFPEKQQVVK